MTLIMLKNFYSFFLSIYTYFWYVKFINRMQWTFLILCISRFAFKLITFSIRHTCLCVKSVKYVMMALLIRFIMYIFPLLLLLSTRMWITMFFSLHNYSLKSETQKKILRRERFFSIALRLIKIHIYMTIAIFTAHIMWRFFFSWIEIMMIHDIFISHIFHTLWQCKNR